MANRFYTINEDAIDTAEDQKYLLDQLQLAENIEPPVQAAKDVKFALSNPFDERYKKIKRESYTTKMTEAEMRELDKYKSYYNANKISYMLKENVDLQEDYDNRLLRYDGNTREVEKINVPKKITHED